MFWSYFPSFPYLYDKRGVNDVGKTWDKLSENSEENCRSQKKLLKPKKAVKKNMLTRRIAVRVKTYPGKVEKFEKIMRKNWKFGKQKKSKPENLWEKLKRFVEVCFAYPSFYESV